MHAHLRRMFPCFVSRREQWVRLAGGEKLEMVVVVGLDPPLVLLAVSR